jgi:2-phosphoglycerate kinase
MEKATELQSPFQKKMMKNVVALVTGGASGLGKATVER